MPRCADCGHDIPEGASFCPSCGKSSDMKCPFCRKEMERGSFTVNTYGIARHGRWHPGDEPPGVWDLEAEVVAPNVSSYVTVRGHICRGCRTLLLRY